MKYRDIIGYSDKQPKKKVVKTQPKPSITEGLKEQFGDVINEGPAYEYEPYMHAISQNYDKYWKSVKDLGRALEKKGLKKQSKELFMAYRKQVSKFEQWMPKFIRKLL